MVFYSLTRARARGGLVAGGLFFALEGIFGLNFLILEE